MRNTPSTRSSRPSPTPPRVAGVEIGAVSVKWVNLVDNEARAVVRRHDGDPRKVIQELLQESGNGLQGRVVVTGPTAMNLLRLPYRPEPECIERALEAQGVDADMLLSLGGETFSIYTLKNGSIKNITSTTKCAAGTGEFLVQQFKRMDMTLLEGIEASRSGTDVKLATRCSVHCKSDATHKLNKGECSPNDIARSLLSDLAGKIHRMVDFVHWPVKKIVVAGGVSQNQEFIAILRDRLPDSELVVLDLSPSLEAYGAALFASEIPDDGSSLAAADLFNSQHLEFEIITPLKASSDLLDFRVRERDARRVEPQGRYILGVDAGSTTTKAVLFNIERGTVDASCYLRTHGNPVAATRNCLAELHSQVGNSSIQVVAAGTTGSGREMVSVYLDNCKSLNEILTHARAAAEEVPNVDTVFEIGGQDSKYISFLDGIPVDYAMNEGCSAGTGSFLEESASSDMDVPVTQISAVAESSEKPYSFGERCAAFINTDLRTALQQGAAPEDVVAGLVYSIADNYISRIVGSRTVGDHLLFQGGVALNRSVGLAMAARTGKKIIVPPYPELMGAVGTALMLRDQLARGEQQDGDYQLDRLLAGEIQTKGTFRCASCDNKCEIQRIEIRGKTFPFGGLCSKFENQRHQSGTVQEGRDVVAVRNELMLERFGPKPVLHERGRIGLPLALTAWELLPFYSCLINELGYEVVLSDPSKAGNDRTAATVCYPCQIAHGAVQDLENKGVDFIFLPHAIEMDVPDTFQHGFTCPTTTVIPDLVRTQFPALASKILSPHIAMRKDQLASTIKDVGALGPRLGLSRGDAMRACKRGLAKYRAYREEFRRLGQSELNRLGGEPTVILAGRPYTTCAPEVNMAVPRKIASRGFHVFPADLLPMLPGVQSPRNPWAGTQQLMNAVAHARREPNFHVCLLSCFSCGPDASMFHLARQQLAGHTFCYLEIDSHTAYAGVETRIGAFLDIIEERRSQEALSAKLAV